MKIYRLLLVSFLVYTFIFSAQAAAAHRPDWGNTSGATSIDDIQVSYAFYRELKSPQQVDRYVFEGQAGQHLHAGIQIPAINRYRNYNVSLALFGPGLPAVTEQLHSLLPDNHLEDSGVMLINPGSSKDYFEPFTQTRYWGRQQLELDLPQSGEYTLLVWNSDGDTGKYVMDVGREEKFTISDVPRFPVWWLQVHLYFEQGFQIGLIALGLLVFLLVFLKRRSNRMK